MYNGRIPMYSNESERANLDSYDDFKLKKNFGFLRFSFKNSAPKGLILADLLCWHWCVNRNTTFTSLFSNRHDQT